MIEGMKGVCGIPIQKAPPPPPSYWGGGGGGVGGGGGGACRSPEASIKKKKAIQNFHLTVITPQSIWHIITSLAIA